MLRSDFDDIAALLAVVRDGSFTRAAARRGVSQSALSQTVRGLKARLGVQLLTRTTRSVSLTEAGERLVRIAAPRLREIEEEVAALGALRAKPSGTIRISAHDHALRTVLWPALERLLPEHPDVRVEVVDYGLTDIVAERFDAGIRVGELVAGDMVAVRVGPDLRSAVVGSPRYFEGRATPDEPRDLPSHRCVNLRLPTRGGLYAWEFKKDGRALQVRVEGQLVFNASAPMLDAALAGLGLAYLPEDMVRPHLDDGTLVRVLADWCPPYPGYHLYYPAGSRPTPALSLLVDALRRRARPSPGRSASIRPIRSSPTAPFAPATAAWPWPRPPATATSSARTRSSTATSTRPIGNRPSTPISSRWRWVPRRPRSGCDACWRSARPAVSSTPRRREPMLVHVAGTEAADRVGAGRHRSPPVPAATARPEDGPR